MTHIRKKLVSEEEEEEKGRPVMEAGHETDFLGLRKLEQHTLSFSLLETKALGQREREREKEMECVSIRVN